MAVPRKPEAAAPAVLDYKPTVAAPIMAPPEHPFVYRWTPDQWELVEVEGKPVLVPQLSKLILAPGVNGVHGVGGANSLTGERWTLETVRADAVQRSAARGFRHLGPELQVAAKFLPPGVEAGPLYRSRPVRTGGVRHHDAFEFFQARAGGATVISHHTEGMHAWLAELKASGAFGEVPEYVIAALRDQLTAELTRKRALNLPADLRDERASGVAKRLAALEAASHA